MNIIQRPNIIINTKDLLLVQPTTRDIVTDIFIFLYIVCLKKVVAPGYIEIESIYQNNDNHHTATTWFTDRQRIMLMIEPHQATNKKCPCLELKIY